MTAMLNPSHPGKTVRFDCIEASGLPVTEAAGRLGCSRRALSRLLNGRAGISPEMAPALERQGWSNAVFFGCACRRPTTWRRRGDGSPQRSLRPREAYAQPLAVAIMTACRSLSR